MCLNSSAHFLQVDHAKYLHAFPTFIFHNFTSTVEQFWGRPSSRAASSLHKRHCPRRRRCWRQRGNSGLQNMWCDNECLGEVACSSRYSVAPWSWTTLYLSPLYESGLQHCSTYPPSPPSHRMFICRETNKEGSFLESFWLGRQKENFVRWRVLQETVPIWNKGFSWFFPLLSSLLFVSAIAF